MLKKNLLALFLLVGISAGAQNLPSDTTLARVLQTDVLLGLLVDSAVKNSPEVRRTSSQVKMFEQNYHQSRKAILNSVLLTSTYGYGNIGNLSLEKDLTGIYQNNYSNVRTSRYNLGVAVQLPLGNLLSRNHSVRSAEVQIDMAEEEKASAALYVKQQVIRLYQDLKLAHALVLASSKMKQSQFISMDMAKKNLRDGQMTVEQFTTVQNEYVKANLDYETQLNKFQTSFLLLEAYTGVQLTRLIERMR